MDRKRDKYIRIRDTEATAMFDALKKSSGLKDGQLGARLIRQEYARRFSQPSDAKLSEVATAAGSNPDNGSFFNAIEPGKAVVLSE